MKRQQDKDDRAQVFDTGVFENLDSELPPLEKLHGPMKMICLVLGVRQAMYLAFVFQNDPDTLSKFVKDSSVWLQRLRNDRIKRDFGRYDFSKEDLIDKYGIPRHCIDAIVGGLNDGIKQPADPFAGICEVCEKWHVCEKGIKCRG